MSFFPGSFAFFFVTTYILVSVQRLLKGSKQIIKEIILHELNTRNPILFYADGTPTLA